MPSIPANRPGPSRALQNMPRLFAVLWPIFLLAGCLSRPINALRLEASGGLPVPDAEVTPGSIHSGHPIYEPWGKTDARGWLLLAAPWYLNSGAYLMVNVEGARLYFGPEDFRFERPRTLRLRLTAEQEFELTRARREQESPAENQAITAGDLRFFPAAQN